MHGTMKINYKVGCWGVFQWHVISRLYKCAWPVTTKTSRLSFQSATNKKSEVDNVLGQSVRNTSN